VKALIANDSPATVSSVYFEKVVRPILKQHCWHCHGEDPEIKANLDTRLARSLIKGGDSGPAVVAGDHSKSLLFQRVSSEEMPPGKKKLSAAEIDVIRKWIDGGALTSRPEPTELADGDIFSEEEKKHWSLLPIVRPQIPESQSINNLRSTVDSFLIAKMNELKLDMSDEADKESLIRRLSFDLIGLPPSPESVDEFLSDGSPDAFDRLADRLMASPLLGERWARHWLDVAGYADSDGFNEKDSVRKWAWRYRDYVVRSMNDDKPWNQFIVEQLAGDELLVPPYQNLSPEQADRLIATGLLRMGPDGTQTENADQEAARNDVLTETIKIVSTSLLGMTVGCAQCHQHRFDPITHADYYRFRALFEPAYDWKQWRNPSNRLISLWSDKTRKIA
ncbi:MAG: DUF1549 domain-containing protein, partial [Planctomycetes bacterium]|nr:DUF1549 domain-containing protein [Planctomycetota bacterium]